MKKASILIIDDSEAVLMQAKRALTAAGFNVITTTQTVGAGQYVASCEIVMIDYFMPGFNGKWVLDSLKQIAKTNGHVPLFYLYTSNGLMGSRYADLGFDGSFSYKGDQDSLVTQVKSAIRLRELLRLRGQTPDQSGSTR
jgi:CheY-like chemotaxis protein